MYQVENQKPEVTTAAAQTSPFPIFVVSPASSRASLKDIVSLAEKHKWQYKVLGRALMPDRPLYFKGWVLVPADQDASDIPDHAMDKVRAIYSNGLRPKGFLLAHEQDPAKEGNQPEGAMSAPNPEWFKESQTEAKQGLSINYEAIGNFVKPLLSGAGKALVITGSLVLGVLSIAIPVAFAIGEAILLDPVLIVVTEDDYWVEIDRWVE